MTNYKLCLFVINTVEFCGKDSDFYVIIIQNRLGIGEFSTAVRRTDASRVRPDVHRFHTEPQIGKEVPGTKTGNVKNKICKSSNAILL